MTRRTLAGAMVPSCPSMDIPCVDPHRDVTIGAGGATSTGVTGVDGVTGRVGAPPHAPDNNIKKAARTRIGRRSLPEDGPGVPWGDPARATRAPAPLRSSQRPGMLRGP